MNIENDREFVDDLSEPEFRLMDPMAFADMPGSFAEYAARNPAILPDYGSFAREVMERIGQLEPGQQVMLTGAYGIGKSTLLATGLLEAANGAGYQPLGSLSIGKDDLSTHPSIFMDSHASFVDAGFGTSFFNPAGEINLFNTERRLKGLQAIQDRFIASNRGILVVDEAIAAGMHYAPSLIKYLAEEACTHGASLILTEPDVPADSSVFELVRQQREQFAQTIGADIVEIKIPEQTIDLAQVPHMAETFGTERDLVKIFEAHPRMGRLRLATFIVNKLARRKREYPDDETIWRGEDARNLLLWSVVAASDEHDLKIFGLTREEAQTIQDLLRPL